MKGIASWVAATIVLAPAVADAQDANRGGPAGSTLYRPAAGPAAAAKAAATPTAKAVAATTSKAVAVPTSKAGAKVASGTTGGRKAPVARKAAGAPLALNGRWEDSQCVPLAGVHHNPPLFVRRHYAFSDARKSWDLSADVFNSDRCTVDTKLLSFTGQGVFTVTGRSAIGKDVYEASFSTVAWRAVPFSREGTLALFNARCGSGDFDEGKPLNLSRSGCSLLGLRSIAKSRDEHELVRIADGKFYLGARSFVPGIVDDRPTQMSGYGLNRL